MARLSSRMRPPVHRPEEMISAFSTVLGVVATSLLALSRAAGGAERTRIGFILAGLFLFLLAGIGQMYERSWRKRGTTGRRNG